MLGLCAALNLALLERTARDLRFALAGHVDAARDRVTLAVCETVGRDLIEMFRGFLEKESRGAASARQLSKRWYLTGLNHAGDVCVRTLCYTQASFELMFGGEADFVDLYALLQTTQMAFEMFSAANNAGSGRRWVAPCVDVTVGKGDLPFSEQLPIALLANDGTRHRFFPLRCYTEAETAVCLWDGRPELAGKPAIAPCLVIVPLAFGCSAEAHKKRLRDGRTPALNALKARGAALSTPPLIERRQASLRVTGGRGEGCMVELRCPELCIVSNSVYEDITLHFVDNNAVLHHALTVLALCREHRRHFLLGFRAAREREHGRVVRAAGPLALVEHPEGPALQRVLHGLAVVGSVVGEDEEQPFLGREPGVLRVAHLDVTLHRRRRTGAGQQQADGDQLDRRRAWRDALGGAGDAACIQRLSLLLVASASGRIAAARRRFRGLALPLPSLVAAVHRRRGWRVRRGLRRWAFASSAAPPVSLPCAATLVHCLWPQRISGANVIYLRRPNTLGPSRRGMRMQVSAMPGHAPARRGGGAWEEACTIRLH